MTFLDLFTRVKQDVWPEQIARNLVVRVKGELQTCLTDLQQAVEMLQDGHETVYPQNATVWKCGATKIAVPPLMIITGVQIEQNDVKCCVIRAASTSKELMQCRIRSCGLQYTTPEGMIDDQGDFAADATNDHTFPPTQYITALYDDTLWIWPWISSTDTVRVTYRGIKRSWADGDLLPASWLSGGEIDHELLSFIDAMISLERRDVQCDVAKFQLFSGKANDRRTRLIYDEARRERNRLQIAPPCFTRCGTGFPVGFANDTTSRPSRLGSTIYIAASGNAYYFLDSLYYLISIVKIDGVVQESVSQDGIVIPI